MANTNAFFPFAVAAGANVETQTAWASDPIQQTGFQAGQVNSSPFNKALRQASIPSWAIAQFIATYGPSNVNDDGNTSLLFSQFVGALETFVGQNSLGSGEGIAVANGDINLAFDPLTAETTLATGTEFAFYDPAVQHHRKIVYSNLAAQILSSIVSTNTFQQISNNPVLWVRSDGSDSNNGLTNSSSGAFQTIAAALAAGTNAYNFGTSQLTIRIGLPGTYASPTQVPIGTGPIVIQGDISNQGAYFLAGSDNGANAIISGTGNLTLKGLTLQNQGTSANTIAVGSNGSITLSFVTSSIVSSGTTGVQMLAEGGTITVQQGCQFSGNAGSLMQGDNGGGVVVSPNTSITLLNTPTFSVATAVASNQGRIILQGGSYVSGTANGQRYYALNYGLINTGGQGANAFPGSTAGSVATMNGYPTGIYA